MGLFFEVLSAINNPERQGSVEQLGGLVSSVGKLASSQGLEPQQLQGVLSALGSAMRPALQQQGQAGGTAMLADALSQVSGSNLGPLQSILTPQIQEQIVQAISQKTGMNASAIQGMLPTLLPAVLGCLNMGKGKPGDRGGNPILSAFLDSDRDGDVDLGDVFKFAGRFLAPQ